ncbi:MAG: MFS transporter [Terriglobales bacterium]
MAMVLTNSQKNRVLFILTLVNFVNYIDRIIVFALFAPIKAEFGLSYGQLGLLGTVFNLIHSPANVVLGHMADRTSPRRVMTFGVLFWSAATFLSGLAGSFRQLLFARALVGVGEAAYAPAGTAVLTAVFPREARARAQGVFNTGMFLGGAVGLALGGILAESVGWRSAFFIVGVPGLLLAASLRRMPEAAPVPGARFVPIQRLLRVPAYVMMLVSGWFATFAAQSYLTWGTEFVHRYKNFGLREAGVSLGATVVVGGVLGVLVGAWLADGLAKRLPWGRVLVVAVGVLVAAPWIFGALRTTSKPMFVALFFAGSFFMSWYHGPVIAIIHDLIPQRAHATAVGISYFLINFSAPTLAPWIVGRIADAHSLMVGMQVAIGAQVLGGLLYFVVIHFIRRDGMEHPALQEFRGANLEAAVDCGS